MTKLPRAIVALAALSVALTACAPAAPDADASPPSSASPVPSLEATVPSPSPSTLPTGSAIADWAAIALPVNRPGGAAPVLNTAGAVAPDQPAALDISQGSGLWDLLLTCQSADGSPISWVLDSPTAPITTPTAQTCPSPSGGTPSTAVIAFDGADATLDITATSDAVYAIQVRPHTSKDD